MFLRMTPRLKIEQQGWMRRSLAKGENVGGGRGVERRSG